MGFGVPHQGVGSVQGQTGMAALIDRHLALALGCAIGGDPVPDWPSEWPRTSTFEAEVFDRIAFHGIALALLGERGSLRDWPAGVSEAMHEEARGQAFWEMGHQQVLTRLIAVLEAAGAGRIITKGSALAYSVYPDPAWRRRGDSDLLVGEVERGLLRGALAAHGFHLTGDARPLQESWAAECDMGFVHVFDLHWRISASPLLAARLERAGIGSRSVPLPRLGTAASGIAPVDNLVLIAINRASHETFGYRSGEAKIFEQDRLIWALDIHLLCTGFTPSDWASLLAAVSTSGTAQVVRSALAFARHTLGTRIPDAVTQTLADTPDDPELARYFGPMSGLDRLAVDFAASPSLRAKLALARYTLFPGPEVLHARFPQATHWPLVALRARRLAEGATQLLKRHP